MAEAEYEVGEERIATLASKGMGQVEPAKPRDRGAGPYDRLILRGATVIDGSGAPPWGPVDIVVSQGRITEMVGVGTPKLPINPARRPAPGDRKSGVARARADLSDWLENLAAACGD